MRKIHYLKEVIQLLKTIQGTEEERKALLQEIAQIEEASLSEMMVWSDKQDASGIVKELFRQLEDLRIIWSGQQPWRWIILHRFW